MERYRGGQNGCGGGAPFTVLAAPAALVAAATGVRAAGISAAGNGGSIAPPLIAATAGVARAGRAYTPGGKGIAGRRAVVAAAAAGSTAAGERTIAIAHNIRLRYRSVGCFHCQHMPGGGKCAKQNAPAAAGADGLKLSSARRIRSRWLRLPRSGWPSGQQPCSGCHGPRTG